MKSLFRLSLIAFAFAVLLAAAPAFAKALKFSELKKTPITKIKDGVVLHGFRFERPEGYTQKDAMIFTHGLESNYHEFESAIARMASEGYDCFAFNFPGHGNGEERSHVIDYVDGDYRMEKFATRDLPLMVEASQELHPGPMKLFGHSMGGMVPRAAFFLKSISPREISAMILVGSPAHFHEAAKNMSFWMRVHLRNILSLGSGESPLFNLEHFRTAMSFMHFLGPIAWISQYVMGFLTASRMEKEMGPLVHADVQENWSHRAMSDRVPRDILRSFADYQDEYPYENVEVPVPVLHIVGDKDTLAPANDIIESAKIQSREAGFWAIRVKDIGHFGIVAPWVIDGYIDTALKFLKSPKRLGKMNDVLFSFSPKELAANNKIARTCEALFK